MEGSFSIKAAALALIAFVVFTIFLFVPLWFVLGFFAVWLSGAIQKWQIWVALPFAMVFGGWVANMVYSYFRNPKNSEALR